RNQGLGDLLVRLARSYESIQDHDRWGIFKNVLSKTLPWQEIYLPIYADAELSRSYQTLEVEGRRFIRLNALQESGELYGLEVAGAIIKSKGPVRIVGGNAVSLSSGQLSLFRFALQICLHIENGTLL